MKKTFAILTLASILCLSFSQSSGTGIPRAQAMFIYNFSRLIEWPASYKSGDFVIGVLGQSNALIELNTYTKGKTVGSQKIVVKRFNTAAEVSKCHILFVPFAKTKMMSDINSSLGSKSTLLVGEKKGACDLGASINFVIVGDKLKFEVKPSNATSKNIKLSSKLSEMAFSTY